jgi:hypothetical protein
VVLKYGLPAAVGIFAAAAVSFAAAQEPQRPTPNLFGERARWTAFLKQHGESELPSSAAVVRLIELNADTDCPASSKDKAGVSIRRVVLTTDGVGELTSVVCGERRTRAMGLTEAGAIRVALADPQAGAVSGLFPAYCAGEESSAKLLEIVLAGRYRLIEWDCDTPPAIRPLAARLNAIKVAP